jgi:integrase
MSSDMSRISLSKGIKKCKAEVKERNIRTMSFTEEQAEKLRDHLKGHHLEAILTLALVTGMRRDELLALKWQDVDLEKRNLSVQNAKTKSSDAISLPEDIAEMLRQHALRQKEAQLSAGLTWANLDLVFTDRRGEPLSPHQLLKEFRQILAQAELPRISFHDLRAAVKMKAFASFRETKGGTETWSNG